ncbi:ABC transporter permease [Aestuariispira insulae]|uniref:Peptide/nickel transport system permease protein n=1 Tax=Aestuariispira insulae TaxID=1461337 RepID=A0A3D9HWB1_9PROT|nr:ABC transporter permease [Aestuariispira insulae]RED53757.1 peptide/nickel transport system permease protein [Aestuariispira insulae]
MGFLLRRVLFYLVAFLCAATFNFSIPRMMPGDPIAMMFSQAGTTLPLESLDALRATFGFIDAPLFTQYLHYLKSVFTGDLGLSIKFFPLSVNEVIGRALPWTLFLVGLSTLMAFAIGSWLGIRSAWRRGGRVDRIATPTSLVLQSVPPVVVALIFLYGLSVALDLFPSGYAYSPDLDPSFSWAFIASVAEHAVLPVISLTLVQVGGYLITMRNNMINLLGEDFITMGRAKGLSDARLRYNYAARNALLPSITSFAMTLGIVLGGSLITEIVFNYPGLGYVLFQGILARDYPLIQGQLMIMTAAMLSANFIADVLYVYLDPRLRKA